MKFSPQEQAARSIVLGAEGEIDLDSIWTGIGKQKTNHWRSKAAELMRRVCLKSILIGPEISRTTSLGRGAKAKYSAIRKEDQ